MRLKWGWGLSGICLSAVSSSPTSGLLFSLGWWVGPVLEGGCSLAEVRALNCGKEGDTALPTLPQVSDATGQMNLTKLADSSPFALELLIPDDCFVLDNGLCGKIYIWKGACGFSTPA